MTLSLAVNNNVVLDTIARLSKNKKLIITLVFKIKILNLKRSRD